MPLPIRSKEQREGMVKLAKLFADSPDALQSIASAFLLISWSGSLEHIFSHRDVRFEVVAEVLLQDLIERFLKGIANAPNP